MRRGALLPDANRRLGRGPTGSDGEGGALPEAHSAGAAEPLCRPACHAPPPRAAAGASVRCPLQALPDGEGGGRCSWSTVQEPPPPAAAAALSGAVATLPLPGVVVIGNAVLPLPGVIVTGGVAAALPLPCNDWSKAPIQDWKVDEVGF